MTILPNPLNEFQLLSKKKKDKITAKYSESFRKYHNLEHISKMWNYYWWHARDSVWSEKMKTAIVFHDVIFIPGDSENEKSSANYMLQEMKIPNFPKGSPYGEIYHAIIATSDHTNPMYDDLPDWAKMFLDLDLYELGSNSETYKSNGKKILEEFQFGSPTILSQESLILARKKWIEKILSSKKIFRHFTEREKQARLNLENNLRNIDNDF